MNKLVILLNARQPCLTARVTTEIVDTMADKSALVLYKELVGCQRLDEIEVIDAEANKLVERTHAPGEWQLLDGALRKLATKRQRLIAAFLADYLELVKRDKKRLRDLYDPNDYPSKEDLKKQFVFKWKFIGT